MQFKNVFLFSVLGGAMAQNAITAGFASIGSALASLDAAVAGLQDGGNVQAVSAALMAKADAVSAAIAAATASIGGSKELTIAEAAGVLAPAQTLLKQTKQLTDDLIAKKPIIVKANQAALVLKQLSSQLAAAKTLGSTIGSKVPAATRTLAEKQSGDIAKEIQRAIAAYS
jgi:hypothetical protein